jgi:hypothetical protein
MAMSHATRSAGRQRGEGMAAVVVGGRLLRGVLSAGAFPLNVAQDVGTMLHPLHPRLKENGGQFF